MTPQLGDTAYGDGQRLVCGAPGEYAGSVEAHFLPDDTAETDAAWIAQRVEEPVSYTHLDVYKRQQLTCCRLLWING